jgi:hypothetical protein
MQDNHTILGVHITDRVKEAVEVQKQLTAFGRFIKTRLGLHEIDKASEAPSGVVLLEVVAPDATVADLVSKLSAIHGVEVQKMVFKH